MDLHSSKPIKSLKDFSVHIATVTLGVLIAIGFEGLREKVSDRHLVRETRQNIHAEMQVDHDHAVSELERITAIKDDLDTLSTSLAETAQKPADDSDQIAAIDNPFYFFSASSWQVALSTGALSRLSVAEVSAYADAAEGIRRYNALQTITLADQTRTVAFLKAHPHPSATELRDAQALVLTLQRDEQGMVWICPQMQDSIDTALRASASR